MRGGSHTGAVTATTSTNDDVLSRGWGRRTARGTAEQRNSSAVGERRRSRTGPVDAERCRGTRWKSKDDQGRRGGRGAEGGQRQKSAGGGG